MRRATSVASSLQLQLGWVTSHSVANEDTARPDAIANLRHVGTHREADAEHEPEHNS